MSIASLRRALVLSILGLVLTVSTASAAGPRAVSRPGHAPGLAETARGVLGLLWATLTSAWGENGATLDPSGIHAGNPGGCGTDLAADNGATIDPNGLTTCNGGSGLTSVWAGEGATLDPNGAHGVPQGSAGAGVVSDEGATIDPDGRH